MLVCHHFEVFNWEATIRPIVLTVLTALYFNAAKVSFWLLADVKATLRLEAGRQCDDNRLGGGGNCFYQRIKCRNFLTELFGVFVRRQL